jgi:hypothetical protein
LFLFFIVLRPCLVAGPVQGLGSRFWLGHQVLTGSPGQLFFLNKNDVVLVKKKKQKSTGLQPGLDRVLLGHTGFFLPLFFLQPGPVPALGRPGPRSTRRTGFQNYTFFYKKKKEEYGTAPLARDWCVSLLSMDQISSDLPNVFSSH